jgi:hypothetical protein
MTGTCRDARRVGASRRFNWSEERATASSVSSIGKHGHLSGGKATHYVYDIRHTADSMALTNSCRTLGTMLYDIRHLVEKE